jgi:hypothetical protein
MTEEIITETLQEAKAEVAQEQSEQPAGIDLEEQLKRTQEVVMKLTNMVNNHSFILQEFFKAGTELALNTGIITIKEQTQSPVAEAAPQGSCDSQACVAPKLEDGKCEACPERSTEQLELKLVK